MPWAGGGRAQGLLIIENQPTAVRLPRPIWIWPGRTPASVPPDRAAAPQVSYRIKELSVHARLVDQVAQVQVSQTFVNTGSWPMEGRSSSRCPTTAPSNR